MNTAVQRAQNTPIPRDRHLAVMQAITRCIKRRGLRKTRMDDIASQAGISRISLYREYGNRDTLINSFLAFHSRKFNERIREGMQCCTSIEEALEFYLLNAALLAAQDPSVRELVEVHQVFQTALTDENSPITQDIREVWVPLLAKLCPADAHILTVSHQDLVDWILLTESNLVLLITESGWGEERLRTYIRNFLIPVVTLCSAELP